MSYQIHFSSVQPLELWNISHLLDLISHLVSIRRDALWKILWRLIGVQSNVSCVTWMARQLMLAPTNSYHMFFLCTYNDSDWGNDRDNLRFTSWSCVYFGPNLMSWSLKKQALVARSSTKVEYVALAHTTSKVLSLELLLVELHIQYLVPTLLCDDLSGVTKKWMTMICLWTILWHFSMVIF